MTLRVLLAQVFDKFMLGSGHYSDIEDAMWRTLAISAGSNGTAGKPPGLLIATDHEGVPDSSMPFPKGVQNADHEEGVIDVAGEPELMNWRADWAGFLL